MTTYGLTSTGFVRKTQPVISDSLKAQLRSLISAKLVLDETTFEGNLVAITSEELDIAWEALEAAIGALDPDQAAEALLVGLCKLTGVIREPAAAGTVQVTCTFDAATTIPAGGLTVHVDGETTNTWTNDAEISVLAAGDSAGNWFTSTQASSDAVALAGTLTGISTPISGLTAVTNPADATAGTDQETLDALRTRREASLGTAGKGTVAAIKAAVEEVDGVIDNRVIENDTAATVDGVPPRSIRVVVWDGAGGAADDDELAQAIYDSKATGTPTYGAESGTALDPWDASKTISFDRATQREVYVEVSYTGTASAATVKAAIVAAHEEVIAEDVLYAALVSAVFGLAGVTNVTSLTLGFTAGPTGTSDLVIAGDEVGVLDTSRVTVV